MNTQTHTRTNIKTEFRLEKEYLFWYLKMQKIDW